MENQLFNSIDEIPDKYKSSVERLMQIGVIETVNGKMELSEDILKMILILARLDIF